MVIERNPLKDPVSILRCRVRGCALVLCGVLEESLIVDRHRRLDGNCELWLEPGDLI